MPVMSCCCHLGIVSPTGRGLWGLKMQLEDHLPCLQPNETCLFWSGFISLLIVSACWQLAGV